MYVDFFYLFAAVVIVDNGSYYFAFNVTYDFFSLSHPSEGVKAVVWWG
jgi:hypothetical protein